MTALRFTDEFWEDGNSTHYYEVWTWNEDPNVDGYIEIGTVYRIKAAPRLWEARLSCGYGRHWENRPISLHGITRFPTRKAAAEALLTVHRRICRLVRRFRALRPPRDYLGPLPPPLPTAKELQQTHEDMLGIIERWNAYARGEDVDG